MFCLGMVGCNNKPGEKQENDDQQESVEDLNPITIVIIESHKSDHLGFKAVINKQFDALALGKATFISIPASQFLASPVAGDLIVYPPTLFGELVKKSLLRAIPEYVVESEPYAINDVLRGQRRIFGVHDKSRYATSLGVSSLMLLCRTDILTANELEVPRTWREYEKVCLELATRKLNDQLKGTEGLSRTWSPAIEPLQGNWKAMTLLARSASSIRSSGRYSVCFDYSNWTPLIAQPPFARSLAQLKSLHELMQPAHQGLDPLEVEAAFLEGQCVLAVTWPHPPSVDESVTGDKPIEAAVYPLPITEDRFDFSQQKWIPADRENSCVPFLGAGGFCCSILRSSKQSGVATRRLALISGAEFSSMIGKSNMRSGFPYRASHLGSLDGWMSAKYAESAKEACAQLIGQQFENQIWMTRLCVDKAMDYEQALAKGIEAVFQKQSIAESLQQVAEDWKKINLGVDPEFQKLLNLESLGVK